MRWIMYIWDLFLLMMEIGTFVDEDSLCRKAARDYQQSIRRVKETPSKKVYVEWAHLSNSSQIKNPDANVDKGFSNNEVITSKYTWWNFLFIFLYENLNPFNKFANFYFVCVAICEVTYIHLLLSYSVFLPFQSQMENLNRLLL